jgi:hypothetical protein
MAGGSGRGDELAPILADGDQGAIRLVKIGVSSGRQMAPWQESAA